MKTLVKLTIPAALLLFSVPDFSQVGPPNITKGNYKSVGATETRSSSSAGSAAFIPDKTIDLGEECSMYLNDAWLPGKIVLKDKTEINGRLFRYNLYTKQMEFIEGKDTAAIGNPGDIASLSIGDRNFVYMTGSPAENAMSGYMEVLVNGKYRLLCCRCIKYRYVPDYEGAGNDSRTEKYYLAKTLYYSNGNSEFHLVPENKREVLGIFDSSYPGLKRHLKNTHNKLNSDDDYVELFSYLNSR